MSAAELPVDILIAGAGPAGLAAGGCLAHAGLSSLILERAEHVGAAWHKHYDRLHLHTTRRHSGLPHLAMPEDWPLYPSRAQVVEYLERYREHFRLEVRFGAEVERFAFRDGAWEATTPAATYRAKRLIVATGYNRVPNRPVWPAQAEYRGRLLHTSEFANGAPHRGERVLIVGMGNSGGEIAIDLVEHGASPTISIRSGVNVIPRDLLGRPTQETGILMEWLRLPLGGRDAIARGVSRVAFGDLSRHGIPPRADGVATQIQGGRIPLIDVGTIDLVKRGAIEMAPGIARFVADGVVFTDGRQARFDTVILATGYRTGLEALLDGAGDVLAANGCPKLELGIEPRPGLHLIGFVNPPTGFLRRIAIDARALATHIARSS